MATISAGFEILILSITLVLPSESRCQDTFTNGLTAYYSFSGDADDKSGHAQNGAIIGYDWSFSSDRFGESNSLYLNATSTPSCCFDGSYVIAPRSPQLDFNQDFTMTVWVNIPKSVGPYYVHNLVSNGDDNNSVNLRVHTDSDSGRDYFQFVGNHTNADVHAYIEPLRQSWWQAAVVRSGTNLSLYRNGSGLTNSQMSATFLNGSAIWLGRYICPGYPSTCAASYPLIGGIDEVRLYNRALSTLEIRQLYQYESSQLPYLTVTVKTIRLSLFVELGSTNVLEASTNLTTWGPYSPPFTASSSVVYQDVDVFGVPYQYFRVRRLVP
jgi:hypothetical protein